MSFRLEVQSEVVIDLQEAFSWYESQKSGLGHEFIEEVELGFEKICNHPLYYTAVNERFRRLKVNRFPYLIVFEVEADTIIVNSIRHTSRRASY